MATLARTVPLFAALALTLVGCAPTSASAPNTTDAGARTSTASAAPDAFPSQSPSPSPSPTPPVAAADCASDGIVPGRLGCIDTNVPAAGNPGEVAIHWEADHCAPGDGRFVYAPAPTLVALSGEGGGEIGRLDVYDPSMTTAAGIHVGSSAAEVAAAYPANPAVVAFSGTQLVVLSGPEGFVTIELADGWGAEPWTVANIRVYAADQDPNVPVYGSENIAGACPMDF